MSIDYDSLDRPCCIRASVPSYHDAEDIMNNLMDSRLGSIKARFPVAFLFIRGDRGGNGKKLAEECIASMNYWDLDSSNYIDILFPGWKEDDGKNIFDTELFYKFKNEIENSSKWRFSGEAEILLLNFDYLLKKGCGKFKFDECISLPIEEMLRKGITTSIDSLIHEIILVSKKIENGNIWDISDNLAFQRTRKSLWDYLKTKFTGGFSEIYDDIKPFAVCNLEDKPKVDFDSLDIPAFLRNQAD